MNATIRIYCLRNALFLTVIAISHKPDKASCLSSFSEQSPPFQTCDLPFLHNYGQSQLCQLRSTADSTKRTTQVYITRPTTRQYTTAVFGTIKMGIPSDKYQENSKLALRGVYVSCFTYFRSGTPAGRQVMQRVSSCSAVVIIIMTFFSRQYPYRLLHTARRAVLSS